MRFRRGLQRSHEARGAHRMGAALHPAIAKVLGAGLPTSHALQSAGVASQGQTDTCFAHAGSGAIWTTLNAQGKPLAFVPSPVQIASCTYADVRAASIPVGSPLPKLLDTGAQLEDVAIALSRWGISPIGSQPVGRDDGWSDVPDDPIDGTFPEPDRKQLEVAGQRLVSGEYSIAVDDTAPQVVAASLVAGIAVWEGGYVSAAYENLGANSIASAACGTDDGTGGGHAQYIVAFRTNAAGALEFRYQNSWGRNWADGGGVWVSTEFLRTRWALYPMAVQ